MYKGASEKCTTGGEVSNECSEISSRYKNERVKLGIKSGVKMQIFVNMAQENITHVSVQLLRWILIARVDEEK